MALTIRKVSLWRTEVDNRPGALAEVLAPLAAAKGDLQVLMGYRIPGQQQRAVVEIAPVTGRKLSGAAAQARLSPPLAAARGDLQVLMGYRIPGQQQRAVIEIAPVTGRKLSGAAAEAGLSLAGAPAPPAHG